MYILEDLTPTKNKCHRKRPNQTADDNPAKTKRAALETTSENSINLELAAFQHLRTLEVKSNRKTPLSGYMEKVQDDINPAMRTELVDWLVEIAQHLRLSSDTLFLTVNYIDRFLSTRKLVGKKLELLGLSCLLVASKYEEIRAPRVADFVRTTKYAYTKDEVVYMESEVLKTLGFETGNPTTKTFLRIFASWAAQEEDENPSRRFEFLCDYVAELSLTDYYGCVGYVPSIVAASAVFVARLTLQPEARPWTRALVERTGYEASELKGCVQRLHNLMFTSEISSVRALRRKYMEREFKYVASMSPPLEIPAMFFKVPRASTLCC